MEAIKTILVTGANRGIGLGIVKSLANMGHNVIIGTREINKGKEADTAIWLATAKEIPTGKFFRDIKVIPW